MNEIHEADPRSMLDSGMFEQFISTASIGFGVQDADERIVYVNAFLAEMLGYGGPSEMVGLDAKELLLPEDREEYQATRSLWPTGNIPMHGLTFRRKDGGRVRALVIPHPVLDDVGRLLLAAAFFVDVSHLLDAGSSPVSKGSAPSLDDLTARERQIVSELVLGKSVREIAQLHTISGHTVRNHIKAVYRKLGVHSRLDLLRVVIGESGTGDTRID
jgi:PAS domain S-box-containing protein